VFVPAGQLSNYTRDLQAWSRFGVRVHGQPDSYRIAQSREHMGRYAARQGHAHFMMCDDDSHFLVRRTSEDWRLEYASHDSVEQMLSFVEELFRTEPTVAHIGLSSREGNNRLGERGTPTELVHRNTRIMRCYAWDTEVFCSLEHGRVTIQEDFDTALQSLWRGHENLLIGYWATGQSETSAPGGCSDYRTVEVHNAAVARMAELWPTVVRTRMKETKTGRELSARMETTISWKRALGGGL